MTRRWVAAVVALAMAMPAVSAPCAAEGYTEVYGGRQFTVVMQRTITEEEFQELAQMQQRQAGERLARGESPLNTSGETGSALNRFYNNADLFIRGFQDVWVATDVGPLESMANLNDAGKRYDFWAQQGIYDNYTQQERAYLNQVVIPAVGVTKAAMGTAGVGLLVGGLAALCGIAFWPAFLAAGAVLAGATAYKAWRMKRANADLASVQSSLFGATAVVGLAGVPVAGGALPLGPGFGSGRVAGLWRAVASKGARGVLSRAGAAVAWPAAEVVAGGGLALSGAYGTLAVINAANIPEPGGTTDQGPKLEKPKTRSENAMEFRIDYALTR